jgi:hypothetical protein
VQAGEALLIEATPPAQTVSWNYQLNNHWMESLDYRCVHTLSTQNGSRQQGGFIAGTRRVVCILECI